MDADVVRAGDGLKTEVYRKVTSSNIYLHYASHHADCIKTGVKCLTKRTKVVCSQEEATMEERAYL